MGPRSRARMPPDDEPGSSNEALAFGAPYDRSPWRELAIAAVVGVVIGVIVTIAASTR